MMNKACMPLNSFSFFVFSADMLVFWASKSQTNIQINYINKTKIQLGSAMVSASVHLSCLDKLC